MPDRVADILSAYEPTLRQRIGDATYDIARYLGMDSIANRMRGDVQAAVDFIPGVGDAVGVDEAARDYQAGNYGMAAAGLGLTAAGMVPGVGDAASAAGRKGIRVFTGGTGDPIKAALDRGAWLSESEDLAKEYAGDRGKVLSGYINPQKTIEFRHAEQSRTIGDIISTALEGAGDFDPEIVAPIVEDLRKTYGNSSMPLFKYWNEDSRIAGLLRSLGYDSISAAEKSNMAAPTWAALTPNIISFE